MKEKKVVKVQWFKLVMLLAGLLIGGIIAFIII